jgi:hypothetical protein
MIASIMPTSSPSCPPTICTTPTYTHPPFTMPTSKNSIRQRDANLRSQLYRELTLATLKEPNSWDVSWRPLLLVYVILRQYPLLESLHNHPYVFERWWSHDNNLAGDGTNLKLLLTNEDGTSMVLLGTSAWDVEDSVSTARWVCSFIWRFLHWRMRSLRNCNDFSNNV